MQAERPPAAPTRHTVSAAGTATVACEADIAFAATRSVLATFELRER